MFGVSDIEFRYRQEQGPGGTVFRPVTSVLLENGRRRFEALMYIDSGADLTTLPLAAGKALGLMQKPGEPILEMRGVSGGGVPYLIRRVRVVLDGERFTARIAWALIEEAPFLLGRLDVFPRFSITFQERSKRIVFRPN